MPRLARWTRRSGLIVPERHCSYARIGAAVRADRKVLVFDGACAQVGRGDTVEIADLHNRLLSGFKRLSRRISRREAGLQIVVRTYATACVTNVKGEPCRRNF